VDRALGSERETIHEITRTDTKHQGKNDKWKIIWPAPRATLN
jgi:hypothetical protein